MFISPYVPTDHTAGTVDPLGLMRPFGFWGDQLFRQFTVLTWHPAYHGFLCFALKYADDHGRVTKGHPLGLVVREMEILWGLINCLADTSILNTRKFRTLLDSPGSPTVTYQACLKRSSLFDRPEYGTLGHYTGPSRSWGLIDERSGLIKSGKRLGRAWGQRGSQPFEELLTAWLAGRTPADLSQFKAHCKDYLDYSLRSKPSAEEQNVWLDIIRDYCDRHPQGRPLWEKPVPPELARRNFSQEEYHKFFEGVTAHYHGHEQLHCVLAVCKCFEELAGLVQTVFDLQYARLLNPALKGGKFEKAEKLLADLGTHIVQDYEKARKKAGLLFRYSLAEKLLGFGSYQDIADAVYAHHVVHQQAKGGTPYFREDQLIIIDQVDPQIVSEHLSELIEQPDNGRSLLAAYQARDWHFGKALTWLEYAGVKNV
jgi:hypothetical protein